MRWPERELLAGAEENLALLGPLVQPVIDGRSALPPGDFVASQNGDLMIASKETSTQAAAGPSQQAAAPSQALRWQKEQLSENPSADYVIADFPDDDHNSAVAFGHPMGKVAFKLAFRRAETGDLFALGRVYEQLTEARSHDAEQLAIRKQLELEFGFDPASPQVQNMTISEAFSSFSSSDLAEALNSLDVSGDVALARANPSLVDMSAQQFLDACRVAHASPSRSSTDADYVPPFVTPRIRSVTNAELMRLKPLFLQLLNDPSINDALFDVIEQLQPAGAAAALYVLEIPVLVEQTRNDRSGLARVANSEAFPLRDIVHRMFKDKRLLPWCRQALARSSALCEDVLASAIQLLTSACQQEGARGSRALNELLRLESDASASAKDTCLIALFDELGEVLRRPTMHANAVVGACQLLTQAGPATGTPYAVQALYGQRSSAKYWRAALRRVRPQVGDDVCEMYLEWLTPTPGISPQLVAGMQTRNLGTELRCDNTGCEQREATHRCSRCKAVRYCSPACQKSHWKTHKHMCKPVQHD